MIANQFKTVILLGLLTALLLWVGQLLGGPQGLIIGLIFALVMNFGSYWFSDKIVLKMYRAKEIKEKDDPTLFSMVHQVAQLANLPMPKVYILPTMSANAFATGRNPKHSAVAFSEGILRLLSKDELKGVIAHELSHIKNRDTLIQTIAATIAGVISFVAFMARWGAIFGGYRDRNNNLVELLVLAIVTPLIAVLLQMAISRSREYLADASAAKTLHSGLGLASALEKLEAGVKHKPIEFGSQSTASLFIVNPFRKNFLSNFFSTHPPMKERIRRLKNF